MWYIDHGWGQPGGSWSIMRTLIISQHLKLQFQDSGKVMVNIIMTVVSLIKEIIFRCLVKVIIFRDQIKIFIYSTFN